MKEDIANWNKEEFKAFLLLHIANADLEISSNELFLIMDDISEENFKQVDAVWSDCNDFECIQIIKELKNKHYPGKEGKDHLIEEMTKLAHADKKFSASEQNFIRSLKRLI